MRNKFALLKEKITSLKTQKPKWFEHIFGNLTPHEFEKYGRF